jgi:hypothetical protein
MSVHSAKEVETRMQYLLLIAGDENRLTQLSEAEHQAWGIYTQDLQASGKLRGGERLRPSSAATTVRVKDGQRLLSDGPYAETKEQLGGYYLIDANDLDEAVEWAGKMPHLARGGSVEVRPIWEMS